MMHEAFSSLLDAEDLLRQTLDVSGIFFIEVMSGECIITFGVLMEKVTCLRFWDIVFGEAWNVLTRGHILLQLAQEGRIDVFLGLPCQSFTFAREPAP